MAVYFALLTGPMGYGIADRTVVDALVALGFGASLNYGQLDFEITLPAFASGREGNVQFESVDDFQESFNAGILIEPSDRTRIGLAYRSEVEFDLTGDVDINDPPPLLQALGLSSGSGSAEIPLPHLIRASLYQKLTDELALLVVHGVLHVLGWDHTGPEETRAMQERETTLLDSLHR